MIPQPITIDGRSGTVLYINASWKPVEPEKATLARVLFADGSTAFYTVSKQRALGGPGSGNFGHQGGEGGKGNPGGSTSTADRVESFRKIFADKGYNTIHVDDAPRLLIEATKLKKATKPMSKAATEGVALGLEDVRKASPNLHEMLKNHIPIVFGEYEPSDASATFAQNPAALPAVQGIMMLNAHEAAMNSAKDPADDNFNVAFRHANVSSTDKEDFERQVWRGVVIHEAGHLADALVDGFLTRGAVSELLRQIPQDKIENFLDQKVSGYAAIGGPQEAPAEIFTAIMLDHELPEELHNFRDEVKKLLARTEKP